MHVRVLADGVPRFDSVTPRGYRGELWVAIHAQSFAVQLHPGTPLTQLRLFTADTRLSELDLEIAMRGGLVFDQAGERALGSDELVTNDQDGAVVLTALVEEGQCGYECIARPDQVLDVARIGVGFAIIALQRAQVVARELEAELARRFPPARP